MSHLEKTKEHEIGKIKFHFQAVKGFEFTILEDMRQQVNSPSYPYIRIEYPEKF